MTAIDFSNLSSTPMSPEELENVEMLTSMMGDIDAEVARRVLLKHGNDIQKAASAMLEGDRAEEYVSGPRSPPPSRPEKDVIDLTTDEDSDMAAALRMSLQTTQEPQFGPSNRAPDPNWAVVPSNKPTDPNAISQNDHTLSRAIEESLATSYSQFEKEEFQERPLDQQIRKDNRPVALRPTLSTLHYAGLVIQALYCVPQLRESIANWRPSVPESTDSEDVMVVEPPKTGPESLVYCILEVFTNMEFALLAELTVDPILREFEAQPASALDNFGDLTEQFLGKLAYIVENVLNGDYANQSTKRLFHLQHGNHVDANTIDRTPDLQEKIIIRVNIQGTEQTNDLVSCLVTQFSTPTGGANQEVIYEPSDIVSFHLVRQQTIAPPPYPGAMPDTSVKLFNYPKYIYMDQFLNENAELARVKREEQKRIDEEIVSLKAEKNGIVNFKNKDALSNLRAATHFYEHIIDRDTPDQQEYADAMVIKLRKAQSNVEEHLKSIDDQIGQLKDRSAALIDDPQLQKHRYDLRAVLVNEGPLGRKHLYSYTHHAGKWWKTVDWLVEEVSEDVVLSDPAGLHYGAGPYLLLYSRALSEEEEKSLGERTQWWDTMRDFVLENNRVLVSQLSEGDFALPESGEYYMRPPSTDASTYSSTSVEPPTPRGAMTPMDES